MNPFHPSKPFVMDRLPLSACLLAVQSPACANPFFSQEK